MVAWVGDMGGVFRGWGGVSGRGGLGVVRAGWLNVKLAEARGGEYA